MGDPRAVYNIPAEIIPYKLNVSSYGPHYFQHTTPSPDSAIRVTKWTKVKELGAGMQGVVWLEREERGKLRAVKGISRNNLRSIAELTVLCRLNAVISTPRRPIYVCTFD